MSEAWWAHLWAKLKRLECLPDVLPPPPVTLSPARVAELEAAVVRAWEPYAAGHIPKGSGKPNGTLCGGAGAPEG
ncbi:hypothetical protein GCM10010844_34350 [Deinococcus radiotolerans]|uniref:Uncharacterized protein n=1 Tax=Deinococcus radiotolerans TaxID=1309407 RepID=A0ABQ2FNY7_9DEIO|nr:hypothetical protein GCM10010844_34350 [Deinococcus radiotolerans]